MNFFAGVVVVCVCMCARGTSPSSAISPLLKTVSGSGSISRGREGAHHVTSPHVPTITTPSKTEEVLQHTSQLLDKPSSRNWDLIKWPTRRPLQRRGKKRRLLLLLHLYRHTCRKQETREVYHYLINISFS